MTFVSYAQNYEDVMLFRALRGVAHGFYIDVGAQDPVEDSVTKAFYASGWRGINIEPVTYWFQRLVADRPHDINLHMAVSDGPGQLHLYEVVDSGLSTTNPDFAARHAQAGYEIHESNVSCLTLDEICATHGVGEIHFLKIDCEGAEAAALRGISLEQTRPWVILLEATEPNGQIPAYEEWEPLLTGRGYHFVYEDGLNRFYVADERAELDAAFSHPPNVFDYFIRASEAAARNQLQAVQGDLSILRDAQHAARVESECRQLREDADFWRNENERREAALVEHRRLLEETAAREAQAAVLLQSERMRHEAALLEQQQLRDELANQASQDMDRLQASLTEHIRERERHVALLAEQQQRLRDEQASHDAQRTEHMRVERDLRDALQESSVHVGKLSTKLAAGRALRQQLTRQLRLLRDEVDHATRSSSTQKVEILSLQSRLEQVGADGESLSQQVQRLIGSVAELGLERQRLEAEVALTRETASTEHAHRRALQEQVERCAAEAVEWNGVLAQIEASLHIRERQISELQGELAQILGSHSWRITSPLRGMRRILGALSSTTRRVANGVARRGARVMVRVPGGRWLGRKLLSHHPVLKAKLVESIVGRPVDAQMVRDVQPHPQSDSGDAAGLSRTARDALELIKGYRSRRR